MSSKSQRQAQRERDTTYNVDWCERIFDTTAVLCDAAVTVGNEALAFAKELQLVAPVLTGGFYVVDVRLLQLLGMELGALAKVHFLQAPTNTKKSVSRILVVWLVGWLARCVVRTVLVKSSCGHRPHRYNLHTCSSEKCSDALGLSRLRLGPMSESRSLRISSMMAGVLWL